MKNKSYIILLIPILISLSCKKDYDYENFNQKEKLTSSKKRNNSLEENNLILKPRINRTGLKSTNTRFKNLILLKPTDHQSVASRSGSIYYIVYSFIANFYAVDYNEITLEHTFSHDLYWDDLAWTELIMAVEGEFGIEIPDEDAERLLSVGNLISYIEQHTNQPVDPSWACEEVNRKKMEGSATATTLTETIENLEPNKRRIYHSWACFTAATNAWSFVSHDVAYQKKLLNGNWVYESMEHHSVNLLGENFGQTMTYYNEFNPEVEIWGEVNAQVQLRFGINTTYYCNGIPYERTFVHGQRSTKNFKITN